MSFEGLTRQLEVVCGSPGDDDGAGGRRWPWSQAALGATLGACRSDCGPVFFSPSGAGDRPVHLEPAPTSSSAQNCRSRPELPPTPSLLEHTGPRRSFHEAPMRRGAGADARGVQRIPSGSPRAVRTRLPSSHRDLAHPRVMASQWMRLARRTERLDLRRKHVRNRRHPSPRSTSPDATPTCLSTRRMESSWQRSGLRWTFMEHMELPAYRIRLLIPRAGKRPSSARACRLGWSAVPDAAS